MDFFVIHLPTTGGLILKAIGMQKRHKARELAMQVLFLWDSHGEKDQEMGRQVVMDGTIDTDIRTLAMDMAAGTWDQKQMIDQRIELLAPQWPPRRQPAVDRNIIRMAAWELTNSQTPAKVVIDEAIELAKQFSTEQSASFVNGVLDALLREHKALIDGIAPA